MTVRKQKVPMPSAGSTALRSLAQTLDDSAVLATRMALHLRVAADEIDRADISDDARLPRSPGAGR